MADSDREKFAKFIAAVPADVSDIHLAAGLSPRYRKNGRLTAGADDAAIFSAAELTALIASDPIAVAAYRSTGQADLALVAAGRRLRLNICRSEQGPKIALRLIADIIPTAAELGLSGLFSHLARVKHGLILVTGPTGSGKTTTIASFLQQLLVERDIHLVTLEDPIEYIFAAAGNSIVTQRELGRDFADYQAAIRSALREDPDVLLIGELRDRETISGALMAAETGALVVSSLHTPTAAGAVRRLAGFFPLAVQDEARDQIAAVLTAVVAQRLLPAVDGGRTAAAEVLVATPAVQNIIRTGKLAQLENVILSGGKDGMITLRAAVETLCRDGRISPVTAEEFLSASENPSGDNLPGGYKNGRESAR